MKKVITIFRSIFRWRRIVISLLILGLAVAMVRILSSEDDFPLFTLKKGHFLIDIRTKGEVKALDSFVISSPSKIWGNVRIVKMVDEGTYVKPGDFLIQFDQAEFMQRLQEERNNLETALANHESKMANIKKQTADLESQLKIGEYSLEQTRLQAKNAVYEAENKRKEIEYSLKKAEIGFQQLRGKIAATEKINEAAIRQSELQIEQARLKLQRVEEDMSQLSISSPTEGLVVYREIWSPTGSEKVKVGSSPWRNQPLMEIPDQSGMKVKTQVNEVDISRLSLDQKVIIKMDAIVDTSFTGKVTSIARLAAKDRRTRKNVFDVEVNFDAVDPRLKPGMSANCQIIVKEIEDTLFVPIDAVVQEEGKTGVYLKDGNFREIATGESNTDFILLEKGLQSGETIRLKTLKSADQTQQPTKKRKEGESGVYHRVTIIG